MLGISRKTVRRTLKSWILNIFLIKILSLLMCIST
ncbi:hypothetical protein [Dictyoglomus sp.]